MVQVSSVIQLSQAATTTPAPASRPAETGPQGKFEELLARNLAARGESPVYEIRPGDTLSEIVQSRLRALGRPETASEIYSMVPRVAQANGLENPNLIFPGQKLDLSLLDRESSEVRELPVQTASNKALEAPPPPSFSSITPLPSVLSHTTNPPETGLRPPVRGIVTSSFGWRRDPFGGTRTFHKGVDIGVPEGTAVYPIRSGRVVRSEADPSYGNVVVVDHGRGLVSLYAHNSQLAARVGEEVTPGLPIAFSGRTGRVTGAHLHLEVLREGEAVDPMELLLTHRPTERGSHETL